MKALLRPSLLLLGTTTALLGGGGMLAYAGWSTETDSVDFTVHAVRIPRVARPTVTLPIVLRPVVGGPDAPLVSPRIGWRDVEVAGAGVHRYVVTRHAGQVDEVVCTVPATRAPSCPDPTAPPGIELTYTVAAAYGDFWVGPDSPPSVPVTIPGLPPVSPSGVPVASGSAPTATPTTGSPPTAVVGTTGSSDPPPSDPPDADVASAEPPVAVAPPTSGEPTVEPMEAVDPSSTPSTSSGPSGASAASGP